MMELVHYHEINLTNQRFSTSNFFYNLLMTLK